MAYVAVISLKKTIHHFLNSSRISVSPFSREILESADAEATSLLQSLKRLDDRDGCGGKRIDALDGRIRDAVHKMEDVLEFHASDQYYGGGVIPIDLVEVQEDLISLYETVKNMEEEYLNELEKDEEDDEDEDVEGVWSSSSIDFGVEMVGISDKYAEIKAGLLRHMRPDDFVVYPMFGAVGTGRTAVARRVFDDLRELFDCGAWVSIGPNYQYKEILMRILSQIDAAGQEIGDGVVEDHLYTSLKGRRYMIVLDDVQDQRILDYMIRCFPEQNNGSLVMYTTSLMALSKYPNDFLGYLFPLHNEYNVHDYLRLPMGYLLESAPPEVEEAGLKIAMNIQGRHLHLIKAICLIESRHDSSILE